MVARDLSNHIYVYTIYTGIIITMAEIGSPSGPLKADDIYTQFIYS
jgi:hypothetical protein